MKFDLYGNAYRIARLQDGQQLGYAQVVDEDGESYDGALFILNDTALHDAPPRKKVDKKIAELQEECSGLRANLLELRGELTSFEKAAGERMARLKRHKALARLDGFLAGTITHYVEAAYGPPKIVAFEDAKADDDYGKFNLKLLTLFGRSGGDLEWKLSQYSDGSGVKRTVTPCTSHDEALSIFSKLCSLHEEAALDSEDGTKSSRQWVERAAEYGISMSPEYLQDVRARATSAKHEQLARLELQIEKLRKDGA